MNNYELETEEYLKHGVRLFQSHLYGNSELEHAIVFYNLCAPRGVGVDMGCGVGEMGHLLTVVDPMLNIVNVTNCVAQRQYMDANGRAYVYADYHSVPLKSESVDFVMFNESIGYAQLDTVLAEAARLLKKAGRLFIKDFCNTTSTTEEFFLSSWGYVTHPVTTLVNKAAVHNLSMDLFARPATNTSRFRSFIDRSRMKRWHDDSKEGNYDAKMSPMLCCFSKL